MQPWLPGLAGGRLILALVLTLLPGVAVGVLGLRGLADKELGLRTHFTATLTAPGSGVILAHLRIYRSPHFLGVRQPSRADGTRRERVA